MVFSSAIFLFCFLPAVFLLYRLPFGRRWQNALLACASLVFYAFGNLHYVPLFLLSVLLNYATGLLLGGRLQRSKPLIALNIVLNLGILCVFKYTDFLIGNANALFGLTLKPVGLILPIGISFYTFQGLSYTIDVYRKPEEYSRSAADRRSHRPLGRYRGADRRARLHARKDLGRDPALPRGAREKAAAGRHGRHRSRRDLRGLSPGRPPRLAGRDLLQSADLF